MCEIHVTIQTVSKNISLSPFTINAVFQNKVPCCSSGKGVTSALCMAFVLNSSCPSPGNPNNIIRVFFSPKAVEDVIQLFLKLQKFCYLAK